MDGNWGRVQEDTTPQDREALEYLCTWASSLNDPTLKTAPSVDKMPSMTTLSPLYEVRQTSDRAGRDTARVSPR